MQGKKQPKFCVNKYLDIFHYALQSLHSGLCSSIKTLEPFSISPVQYQKLLQVTLRKVSLISVILKEKKSEQFVLLHLDSFFCTYSVGLFFYFALHYANNIPESFCAGMRTILERTKIHTKPPNGDFGTICIRSERQ